MDKLEKSIEYFERAHENVDNLQIEDIGILIKPEPTKSTMKLGLITYHCPISFNRLQRWLWKICFGVEVNNTKEERNG